MLEPSLIEIFTRPLDLLRVEYMITGSVAAMIYGKPRLTHDIDLVLALKKNQVDAFVRSFPIDQYYCPPADYIKLEVGRKCHAHCNIIHHQSGFKADCYFMGDSKLHQWGMSHKKSVSLLNQLAIWVAPPEYVILKKLDFFREGQSQKHLADIQAMRELLGDTLNMKVIQSFCRELGLKNEWRMACEFSES